MMLSPLRILLTLLSPAGMHGRLSILIYHRVLKQPDPLFPAEVDADTFDQQMCLLSRFFTVIPLAEAICALNSGRLPARAACITFDDGYADNADVALPILQKYRLPAAFFIATAFLDGGRMWNDTVIEMVRRHPASSLDLRRIGLGLHRTESWDQRAATVSSLLRQLKYHPPASRLDLVNAAHELTTASLPDDLMMSSQQVRALHAAGMEIGAHTVNHPILASLGDAAALREIAEGKECLEALIGARVKSFAYPNGKPLRDYHAGHVDIVRKLQFDAAVSTSWGTAQAGNDLFQLPRFTPWDKNETRFLLRLARNMRSRVDCAGDGSDIDLPVTAECTAVPQPVSSDR